MVRCAVGEVKVEAGLHQETALSLFLFDSLVLDRKTEIIEESPWTLMFAGDIVICGESRVKVEESLDGVETRIERKNGSHEDE
ncbi:hypothetical protein D4764_03G0006440 [Takifugu flavidus]|uniref:Reverse transcriptase domain-containing protein n=1 Tax=Takifugu flavidus TaxID=433684 RepID=A0A5C6N8R2_9TELE|nr:hypothetical protein D4764_03G0006440 [Takifugu flavidus]